LTFLHVLKVIKNNFEKILFCFLIASLRNVGTDETSAHPGSGTPLRVLHTATRPKKQFLRKYCLF
jgi:hypothetical protein